MVNEQNNQSQNQPNKSQQKRTRSPFLFPAYDFSMARQIAERVEKDGAGSLSDETLAIAMHLSAKSSGFQLKTLTARQFGLLTKQGQMLSTTPLAKSIIKPMNEIEKKNAMVQSFMAIPLFREVATRFKGRPLPQGQDFRNILEREFKVDSRRVSDAERVLMDTARDTGVLITSGSSTYISTGQDTLTQQSVPTQSVQESITTPTQPVAPSASTPLTPSSGILTISEDDLAEFEDTEFQDVWNALGKIVRARGKRQRAIEEQVEEKDKINEKE
jgi:hypothetical protein